MNKVIGIVGASGLIGSSVAQAFTQTGAKVIRISRSLKSETDQEWRLLDERCLQGLDILINLAGEPIDQRWSDSNQSKFFESRVGLTQKLHGWIQAMPVSERPSVWLNASAVGIYGDRGDEILDELSEVGDGYLATLCSAWEEAATSEPIHGCRVVCPRIGVVLGRESKAWVKMKRAFSFGLGGKLGRGNQWFPWIHLEDAVSAFVFLTQNEAATGAYNIVAPMPVTNVRFTQLLGHALHRPTLCTVPVVMLRIMLGQFSEALLASHRVSPRKLEEIGFKWNFSELDNALSELCE